MIGQVTSRTIFSPALTASEWPVHCEHSRESGGVQKGVPHQLQRFGTERAGPR